MKNPLSSRAGSSPQIITKQARIPARIQPIPFEIILAKSIRKDLEYIPKKHHSSIQQAIQTQLLHEANVETTNRKPLVQSIQTATWELRCGKQNQY
jgi:hypothetical protein